MAKVLPFRGILYNQEKIKDLELVTTLPYDVITLETRDKHYDRHPYNIIRIILGKESPDDDELNNKYTRAAQYLEDWLREGVLVVDEKPAIYLYEQEYMLWGNECRARHGFIALMQLEDYKSGVVYPHEATSLRPQNDRRQLLKVCKASFEPIFCLYNDPDDVINDLIRQKVVGMPIVAIRGPDGVSHRLWRIADEETIKEVAKQMMDKQIFIADGHHRYQAALSLRGEFNYVMVYLTNMNDEGLTILPVHRVLRNLSDLAINGLNQGIERFFHMETLKFHQADEQTQRQEMFKKLRGRGKSEHVFGMYRGDDKYYLLILKDKETLEKTIKASQQLAELDVTILHGLLIDRVLDELERTVTSEWKVLYTSDEQEAIELVNRGLYQLAFFLNSPQVAQVRNIALAHQRMPHKSTYFYPKPLSGLVMCRYV